MEPHSHLYRLCPRNGVDPFLIGDPWENRTPVAAVRGRSLNRLTNGPFGAPSGTRTQDPLIKSQLLSQVASSRGVENSVTQTDSGLYIYFYNLCLTVLENNIISDHLQLISPLSIGSVADYVYRAICFSNFLIKCCSCF